MQRHLDIMKRNPVGLVKIGDVVETEQLKIIRHTDAETHARKKRRHRKTSVRNEQRSEIPPLFFQERFDPVRIIRIGTTGLDATGQFRVELMQLHRIQISRLTQSRRGAALRRHRYHADPLMAESPHKTYRLLRLVAVIHRNISDLFMRKNTVEKNRLDSGALKHQELLARAVVTQQQQRIHEISAQQSEILAADNAQTQIALIADRQNGRHDLGVIPVFLVVILHQDVDPDRPDRVFLRGLLLHMVPHERPLPRALHHDPPVLQKIQPHAHGRTADPELFRKQIFRWNLFAGRQLAAPDRLLQLFYKLGIDHFAVPFQ